MLSDLRIRSLKPSAKDRWISDGHGLYLRIRTAGARAWVLRRKHDGDTQVVTLGNWPDMSLAEARVAAAKTGGKRVSTITLGALLETWHEEIVQATYRRPREVSQYFDRIEPALRTTKLRNLDRLAIRSVLKRYADQRGPVAANRLLSILKTALQFAVDAGHIKHSPIAGMSRDIVGGREEARDRTLSDAEMLALWNVDCPHRDLLRFLLLTGQRIGETQSATRDHIDGARWSIPKENSKSKRDHWVALSTQALALIANRSNDACLADGRGLHMRDAERHIERAAQHLFYSGTLTGVQAWLRRFCEREKIAPAFTPHDLRRTVATRLNELGVPPHIVEKIVGHRLQGVMAVYNRADYTAERIAAMQKWGDEVERIVGAVK